MLEAKGLCIRWLGNVLINDNTLGQYFFTNLTTALHWRSCSEREMVRFAIVGYLSRYSCVIGDSLRSLAIPLVLRSSSSH